MGEVKLTKMCVYEELADLAFIASFVVFSSPLLQSHSSFLPAAPVSRPSPDGGVLPHTVPPVVHSLSGWMLYLAGTCVIM